MEAEVLGAELGEELERVVHLGERVVHRVGVLAVPRALGGAVTEGVGERRVEGVPPCDAEAQPVLHLLAGDDFVGVIILEAESLDRAVAAADVLDLVDIPQSHGSLLC